MEGDQSSVPTNADPRCDPVLFPTSTSVTPLSCWLNNLQKPVTSQIASLCYVERVVHYKALDGVEHEFLIVYARHTSGYIVVLGVDRNADQHMDQMTAKRYVGNKLMSTFNSIDGVATAFDGIEVSHDATPLPILTRHGRSIELNTLTFAASMSEDPPTLHQLTALLLAIHSRFPTYNLLEHQCYFFARAIFLSLSTIFAGIESPHPTNNSLQGAWRRVHVSQITGGINTAMECLHFLLPVLQDYTPARAGFITLYTATMLYCETMKDSMKICDDEIRTIDIPGIYREVWTSYSEKTLPLEAGDKVAFVTVTGASCPHLNTANETAHSRHIRRLLDAITMFGNKIYSATLAEARAGEKGRREKTKE